MLFLRFVICLLITGIIFIYSVGRSSPKTWHLDKLPRVTTYKIRIFVGIVSACKNRRRRETVRRTWATHPLLQRVVFVLNRPTDEQLLDMVIDEANYHHDIILLGQIHEHYYNITYQTLEIFRSAYAYNQSITHVVKCDDDSYIHAQRLEKLLIRLPKQLTWIGNLNKGYRPNRNPKSKWFVPVAEWPQNYSNVVWANGPGYVVTRDLAYFLATGVVAKCMPEALFKLEDIAVGAWLACLARMRHLHITKVSSPRFTFWGCQKGDLISHYITPERMACMFQRHGQCCRHS